VRMADEERRYTRRWVRMADEERRYTCRWVRMAVNVISL
jgi:hypothetical protein